MRFTISQWTTAVSGSSCPPVRFDQKKLPLVTLSCITMLTLASCARADDPELFRADPNLLNDFTQTLPSYGSSGGIDYAIIQGLAILEGDIVLGPVDRQGKLLNRMQTRGIARSDAFGRWPDGIVPYLSPVDNSPTQQAIIRQAIDHWMARTRISFVERTAQNAAQYPNYLRFDNSNSCASYVGMQGGEQSILVSDACSAGSIIHEIGHALGLFHEHTRSDRDNYVQIDWSQIVKDKDINFSLQNAGTQNVGPYDYGSIMHYGEYFFSATGKPTIIVPDGVRIGQRNALSETDAASVDQMYATDLALLPPVIATGSSGLELGITVLNQGDLGAHELELVVRIADDSLWQGVSSNSGWVCLSQAEELRCSRDTLAENTESRFTLFAEPGSGTEDDVMLLLSSRTLDLNSENNRYNDHGSTPLDSDAKVSAPTVSGAPVGSVSEFPVDPLPDIAAATPAASGDVLTRAGSINGGFILTVLGLIGWRRRRTTASQ